MSGHLRVVRPDEDLTPAIERRAVWSPFIVAVLAVVFVAACLVFLIRGVGER